MEPKIIRFTRSSKIRQTAFLILLLLDYALQNSLPYFGFNNSLAAPLCKLLFLAAAVCLFLIYPKVKYNAPLRIRVSLIWVTVFSAIIYICISLISGALGGFAKSPYDHSPFGVFTNSVLIVTVVFGREIIRNYLLNGTKQKSGYIFIGIVTLLMTITELPTASFGSIRTRLSLVTYIGEIFIPKLGINLFACYLVYYGGALLSILYIGIIQSFIYFFPVQPNPGWNIKVLIDILCPVFSLMFLQYFYLCQTRKIKDSSRENPVGWVITTLISILIIWFAAGVFPVQPFVVATGSMEPVIYAGDVVLVKKIDPQNIKTGDIVQYESQNVFIFHRVINIIEERQEVKYQTKGDNNSAVDFQPVRKEQIRGRVVCTVPKIGWPTLLLKRNREFDRGKYEF